MNSDAAAVIAFLVIAGCAIAGTLAFIDSLERTEQITREHLAKKEEKSSDS